MIEDLHRHSRYNKEEIETSATCGCFSCKRIFRTEEVEDYIDSGQTVLCPYCGCDSLIANGPEVKLTEKLLVELNKRYF